VNLVEGYGVVWQDNGLCSSFARKWPILACVESSVVATKTARESAPSGRTPSLPDSHRLRGRLVTHKLHIPIEIATRACTVVICGQQCRGRTIGIEHYGPLRIIGTGHVGSAIVPDDKRRTIELVLPSVRWHTRERAVGFESNDGGRGHIVPRL